MSLGFGHLVGVWIPAKFVECKRNSSFSLPVWFLLFFGSILPDADFFLDWLGFANSAHRSFTHSLMFVVVCFGVGYGLAAILKKNRKNLVPLSCALALSLGVASHLVYDIFYVPGINVLWPFNWWLYGGTLYFTSESIYSRVGTLSEAVSVSSFIIDMGLGAAWFFYFLLRGRLKP